MLLIGRTLPRRPFLLWTLAGWTLRLSRSRPSIRPRRLWPNFWPGNRFWRPSSTFITLAFYPASPPRVCAWGDREPVPPSFTCTPVFSRTFMSPSPSMSLQWASFRHSMWLPPRFTQTPGRPSRPFACCVTLCVFTPPPLAFFLIILLTPQKRLLGIFWSVGRTACCLTPSPSPISVLRSGLWRLSFGPRRRLVSLTRPASRGFLSIGLARGWGWVGGSFPLWYPPEEASMSGADRCIYQGGAMGGR